MIQAAILESNGHLSSTDATLATQRERGLKAAGRGGVRDHII